MASGSYTARAVAPDESPQTGAVTFRKWTAFANPAQFEVSYGEKSPNLSPATLQTPTGTAEPNGKPQRKRRGGKSGCGGARKHSVQPLLCARHGDRAAVPAGCSQAQRGMASLSGSINSNKNTNHFHAHDKHLLKIHHELVIK